jgi:myosin regulatory light chain 12
LANVGDQFSKDEIKQVWKEIPLEAGQIDYHKFVTIMKRGGDD